VTGSQSGEYCNSQSSDNIGGKPDQPLEALPACSPTPFPSYIGRQERDSGATVPLAVSYSRRIASRILTNAGVYAFWSCNGRDDLSRVRDLSVGGLFIETRRLKDLGAHVKVHFLVSEGQIRAETVVRHVEPGHGLGLKFTVFNDQDLPRFAALMNRLRN
jgi:hypothetical protein